MKLQDYIQNKPILETDRLLLRPLQYDDAADLKEWLGGNSLYQYWGKRPGKSGVPAFPNLSGKWSYGRSKQRIWNSRRAVNKKSLLLA